jgi:flagellar hook-associated protein 3 FlgL
MRVDPSYVTNLVGALNSTQARAQQLTSQISSGVRVNSLSDDPLAAGENVLLLNQMQQDDTFTQSSAAITGQLQVADSALGQVVSQLTQAISLATAANNGTMSANDRASIANQLAGIRSEVLSLANSSYQGQYIFGGGQTANAPFALNAAVSPATVLYGGDVGVNYVETPNGQQIQMNVPGGQIFTGPGSTSVFGALNKLIADYSAVNTDTSQVVADTTALSTALGYVSQQRVTIDNSVTQLNAASGAVSSQATQLTAAQTNLMQADVAQIATQLALAQTQQTALESVIAQMASGSLFDKLR